MGRPVSMLFKRHSILTELLKSPDFNRRFTDHRPTANTPWGPPAELSRVSQSRVRIVARTIFNFCPQSLGTDQAAGPEVNPGHAGTAAVTPASPTARDSVMAPIASASSNVWSERPRYEVINKTSARRLLRFLDLGPSLLSVVASNGMTEKRKYAYRELKIKLVDVTTLELDRVAEGTYILESKQAVQLFIDLYRRWRGKPAVIRDFDGLSILTCRTAASTFTADLYSSRLYYFLRLRLTNSVPETAEFVSKGKFFAMFSQLARQLPPRQTNTSSSPSSNTPTPRHDTGVLNGGREHRTDSASWEIVGDLLTPDNAAASAMAAAMAEEDGDVVSANKPAHSTTAIAELVQEFLGTLTGHFLKKIKRSAYFRWWAPPASTPSDQEGAQLELLRPLDSEYVHMLRQDPKVYSVKRGGASADSEPAAGNEARDTQVAAIIRLCLEDVLVRSCARVVWHEIQLQYQRDDQLICAAMCAHRGKPQSFWGISHPSTTRWNDAIEWLNRVEGTILPTSKLFFVQQSMNAIFTEMRRGDVDTSTRPVRPCSFWFFLRGYVRPLSLSVLIRAWPCA
eukprot:INCI15834.1.p1 GENE.INCI15834.1~~INCI15834.1.p1  ORF type:complete len:631 (+),score=88.71 INCI15834.1:194-1894(+)